jgi:hypothetical protein
MRQVSVGNMARFLWRLPILAMVLKLGPEQKMIVHSSYKVVYKSHEYYSYKYHKP